MKCRVCDTVLLPWGVTANIPLLRCGVCGSLHADCPKPAEDLYAELYEKDEIVPDVVASSLDAVVSSMEPYRSNGRWLDVAFGQGALLDAAARRNWRCYGSELSSVALRKGRARGFVTAAGTSDFENGSFDVVSMVEFVEHVEDPSSFLREARRVLRPGGCLYITTPNAWSANRWLLGAAWSVFAPPDHVTIFTPGAMTRLLTSNGFGDIEIRAEGLNPSELRRKPKGSASTEAHRVNAATELCVAFSATPGRRRMKSLINSALSLTRLGDTLKIRGH